MANTFTQHGSKKMKMRSKAAGLKHIRIHDFRHAHASRGINIQKASKRLGHSNVQTTWKIYAHLYPTEEDHSKKGAGWDLPAGKFRHKKTDAYGTCS